MATTKITRTLGTPTNIDKWTYSVWLKQASTGADRAIVTSRTGTSGAYLNIIFQGNNQFRIYGTDSGGLNDFNYQTNRLFRDTSAWYHIVVAFDNTLAAAGDRCKIYVNGVQETSFIDYTDPASGVSYVFNKSGYTTTIGARTDNTEYWDGEMSHINFVDGTQLTPSSFGETDATDGMWKIKTSPSVTYGNNGFFMKMEDSTNLDLDSSGNSISFTTTGTLTATEDCSDNNFCTGNNLNRQSSGGNIIYTNGNNTIYNSGNTWRSAYSTLGDNTGKYYFETKIVGASGNWWVGIVDASQMSETAAKFVAATRGYGTNSSGHRGNSGSEVSWAGDVAYSQNDIVMIAFDMTNNFIYFGRNGTWANSGDPTSGASGTGSPYAITADKFYIPAFSFYGATAGVSPNFGNGVFGTTSISSEGTNASGIGKFEYDVPTGYTALSTKGLNE